MKSILKIILVLLIAVSVRAQKSVPDSLREALQNAPHDSSRYQLYYKLLSYYGTLNLDSTIYFADKMLFLAQKNKKKLAEARALNFKGEALTRLGQYASALNSFQQAFDIADDPKKEDSIWAEGVEKVLTNSDFKLLNLGQTHSMFANLMQEVDNTTLAIIHFKKAKLFGEKIGNTFRVMRADQMLGNIYRDQNMLDSALIFEKNAEYFSVKTRSKRFLSEILSAEGDIYFKKGDKKLAKEFYYDGIRSAKEAEHLNWLALVQNYFGLTKYYLSENDKDSSLLYAKKALKSLQSFGFLSNKEFNIGTAYENLYHCYQLRNEFDSAFKYQGLTLITKDSLYNKRIKNLTEFQNLSLQEQLRLQELEKSRVVLQNRARTYTMLAVLAVALFIVFLLYRNNRQKQKANLVLEKTLSNLKTTQSQLIQSEKMASLGELTAGVAHEIQNPLNFVNNFSEVNIELIEELKSQKSKAKTERDEKLEDSLFNDIAQNLEKINHHGKRADAIVKSMLQHSRSNTGKKEPTDINALCDEYLRLAYYGLRAKNKNFNATMVTEYDASIFKINIIPQDIGRVILNLITNAFYAVTEKKKKQPEGYQPTVTVITKKMSDKIVISVKDNGNGIPQKVIDKIYQPFFTTKPTGEGTGLGLSMSYDIVTKGHGGTIKAETEEGKYAEFKIILPT